MKMEKTQDRVQRQVDIVRELLDKQRLVESMVHASHQRNQDVEEGLVHRQHLQTLQAKLNRMHSADIAHVLEVLPLDERMLVWRQVFRRRGGALLLELSDTVRQSLIQGMGEVILMHVLQQMDADDIAYIADDIPEAVLEKRAASLSRGDRDWIRSAMAYEENQVGALMSQEMVVADHEHRLGDVLRQLRQLSELPIHTDKLFVVDRYGMLLGVLGISSLLLGDPEHLVKDSMAKDVVEFLDEDNADDMVKAFERYDLASAPVVNHRGKLIGRLTVDVVMDYFREQSSEDVLTLAGFSEDEDLFAPISRSLRNRAIWLLINLGTAFIASRVIGLFEDSIAQLVALAALMPIVASVGGNIGNQTTAIIIRAIALGQIHSSNTMRLIRKELSISVLNGLMLGAVVGLFAYLFYHNIYLSAVISAAMLMTLMIAALAGLIIPMLLERNGRDPALGSPILITATTDSVGFMVFLGLATVFLL